MQEASGDHALTSVGSLCLLRPPAGEDQAARSVAMKGEAAGKGSHTSHFVAVASKEEAWGLVRGFAVSVARRSIIGCAAAALSKVCRRASLTLAYECG